jgi:pimeloyl-ACP methyl ester carboxylesterase
VAHVILLHGTTQSPRGWEQLVSALGERGHQSHCPDLPSGTYSGDEYAVMVEEQLSSVVREPVVVAHSGTGLLLPAVARRLGASHQVWLATAVPDGSRSFTSEITAHAAEMFNEEWIGANPVDDPVLAAYFLFHDCDLATLRWALETLRLFVPDRLYNEPVALATEIPSTAIVGAHDRTLRPGWSLMAARDRLHVEAIEVECGHCPHVSRPFDVATIIDGAIR